VSRKRKLLILAGILLAALVAAAPFLRPPEGASDAPQAPRASSPKLHLAASQDDEAFDLSVIADETDDPRDVDAPRAAAVIRDQRELDSTLDQSEKAFPLPELPDDFSTSLADDRIASSAASSPPANVSNDEPAPQAPSVVSEPASSEEPPSALRRHTVRDGETLQSLAARLLGDAKYAEEIYRLNRERLPRRDLLPIGVELLIPDVESAEE
jgi:nucleoid-associated protein YgaU